MSVAATAVARYQPVLSDVERMTMLGFLAAYRGYTGDAYTLNGRHYGMAFTKRSDPRAALRDDPDVDPRSVKVTEPDAAGRWFGRPVGSLGGA
jgi:hypothetical protein